MPLLCGPIKVLLLVIGLTLPGAVCLAYFIMWLYDRKGGKPPKQEKIEVDPKQVMEEYKLYGGFFQYFLDFGLKANVFFYAITGGILTILYNSSGPAADAPIRERLGLLVGGLLLGTPFLIGCVLAFAFLWGATLWRKINRDITGAREAGELPLRVTPYLHYLTVLLTLFGIIFTLVSLGLLCLMWTKLICVRT